ncbi:hypothetical protein LTR10_013392 [Elasticomyces elasticus]|uniref:NAD(P)-binding protein n=1 Tax=Exophiala sideris TaxID=1016849 RepID=A0ABR0J4I9_9EURO|nr:hypothetical protein LTR10_013392 [Elasticomyces elasticus]KAK5027378.1 hypothetical protein LTS07_006980 [Exophiala sideris]KAK5034920.1 hypothetical protein LTR13_006102 [Exophiala sideris]KAK5056346.1 hypothetical protein LTR69_007887 [Exophiala sideris]KAK5181165.1 hypothetical protein LTR44_006496 [Eurotiomycetes sp. CCFEE 6388]
MPLLGFMNPFDNVHNFIPDKDIAIGGKVIIVTGGNSGCGRETVLQLAKHQPRSIYLAARTKEKYQNAIKEIAATTNHSSVRYLELDLASLASVKKAAEIFLSKNDRLDILINNAGIMGHPQGQTEEGYEIHFGTNYFLDPSTSSSDAKDGNDGVVLSEVKTGMTSWSKSRLYGQSKLANILHARELARRYPKILSTSLHPGRVETKLADVMTKDSALTYGLMRVSDGLSGVLSVQDGALTQLWAATAKRDEVKNGAYYMPVGKEKAGSKLSRDPELAKALWEWTEREFHDLGF